jgi:hypothetical protein
MRDPLQALEAARRAAAAGAAEPTAGSAGEADWALQEGRVSLRQLARWAIIEPDEAEVYSTRRLGRPITALKRLLIRLLRQYLGQLGAQQSRFNAQMAAHAIRLEERVAALEEELRSLRPPQR